MEAGRAHEMALFRRLLDGVERIPGIRVWGITDRARFDAERAPTLAITIEGTNPQEACRTLGDRGIFTWDGHFYALGLIERLGLLDAGGVVRIGLAHYTTAGEIDRLLGELDAIAAAARGGRAGTAARA
jgi:selenocysteine lyase/cysteine desulfurase